MTVIFTVLETQMAVAQVRFLLHAAKKTARMTSKPDTLHRRLCRNTQWAVHKTHDLGLWFFDLAVSGQAEVDLEIPIATKKPAFLRSK
jgi:hypothetical protein